MARVGGRFGLNTQSARRSRTMPAMCHYLGIHAGTSRHVAADWPILRGIVTSEPGCRRIPFDPARSL